MRYRIFIRTLIVLIITVSAAYADQYDPVSFKNEVRLVSENAKPGDLLEVNIDANSGKKIATNVYKYRANIYYAGNNPCRVLVNCDSGRWKVLVLKQNIDNYGNNKGFIERDMGWERTSGKNNLCD